MDDRAPSTSDGESRTVALSPLTDDEVTAIRTFLRRHGAGHRARQRRMNNRSEKYDFQSQIVESYLNHDDFTAAASDTSSHFGTSSSDGEDHSTGQCEELETPVDCNRATFGYYGLPHLQVIEDDLHGEATADQTQSQCSENTKNWRDAGGDYGDIQQVLKTLRAERFSLSTSHPPITQVSLDPGQMCDEDSGTTSDPFPLGSRRTFQNHTRSSSVLARERIQTEPEDKRRRYEAFTVTAPFTGRDPRNAYPRPSHCLSSLDTAGCASSSMAEAQREESLEDAMGEGSLTTLACTPAQESPSPSRFTLAQMKPSDKSGPGPRAPAFGYTTRAPNMEAAIPDFLRERPIKRSSSPSATDGTHVAIGSFMHKSRKSSPLLRERSGARLRMLFSRTGKTGRTTS